MRRFGLIAVPVVAAAAALLVAGCGHYSEKTVSPLPQTVEGKAQPAPAVATTTAATTTVATTTAATTTAATTAPAATTTAAAAPQGDPAAGKAVFASAGCAACHTLAAAGSSGNVGPNLDTTKPPLALVLDRVTNGKGAMPPFKGRLQDAQIQDVAAYVVQATSGG